MTTETIWAVWREAYNDIHLMAVFKHKKHAESFASGLPVYHVESMTLHLNDYFTGE